MQVGEQEDPPARVGVQPGPAAPLEMAPDASHEAVLGLLGLLGLLELLGAGDGGGTTLALSDSTSTPVDRLATPAPPMPHTTRMCMPAMESAPEN